MTPIHTCDSKSDFLSRLERILEDYNSPSPQWKDTTYNLKEGDIPFPKEEVSPAEFFTPEEVARYFVFVEREMDHKRLGEEEKKFLQEFTSSPKRHLTEGGNSYKFNQEKKRLLEFYAERDKRERKNFQVQSPPPAEPSKESWKRSGIEEYVHGVGWVNIHDPEYEKIKQEVKKGYVRPRPSPAPEEEKPGKAPERKNIGRLFRNLAAASALGIGIFTLIKNPDLAAEYIPFWNSAREKREIAQEHYDTAGNLWKEGELNEAEQSLEEAIKFNPKIDGSKLLAAISASRQKSEGLEAEGDRYFSRKDYGRAEQKYVAAQRADWGNSSIDEKMGGIEEMKSNREREVVQNKPNKVENTTTTQPPVQGQAENPTTPMQKETYKTPPTKIIDYSQIRDFEVNSIPLQKSDGNKWDPSASFKQENGRRIVEHTSPKSLFARGISSNNYNSYSRFWPGIYANGSSLIFLIKEINGDNAIDELSTAIIQTQHPFYPGDPMYETQNNTKSKLWVEAQGIFDQAHDYIRKNGYYEKNKK